MLNCSQQHSTETQLLWKNKTSNRETIEPLHFRSHQGHEIPTGGKKGEVEEMKRQKTTNQYVLCIVYWDPNKREERREKWRRWRDRKQPNQYVLCSDVNADPIVASFWLDLIESECQSNSFLITSCISRFGTMIIVASNCHSHCKY